MRTAFVKQALDLHGPWRTITYRSGCEVELASAWATRALMYEATCLLEADWYVIDQVLDNDYIRQAVLDQPGRRALVESHVRDVVDPTTIPFDDYDVIICMDPVLDPPPVTRALVAYYVNEHWDDIYRRSLHEPVDGYDLFLAHMLDASSDVDTLPASTSFPYMKSSLALRRFTDEGKQDVVWADWRVLTALAGEQTFGEASQLATDRLSNALGMPVRSRATLYKDYYGVGQRPKWGDLADYFRELAACRYYVAVGRTNGAGQGICDAATLGLVAFGEFGRPYHELVCHPEALCANLYDLPARFRRVQGSAELQAEVLAHQDAAIDEHFVRRPLELLKHAAGLKQQRG